MASEDKKKAPENKVVDIGTKRVAPKPGRYDPPAPLSGWLLAAADASHTDDGVLSARELELTLVLPSFPVKVHLFLLYEIPFAIALRGALLNFQVERPTGEDAREFTPDDTRTLFDERAGVAVGCSAWPAFQSLNPDGTRYESAWIAVVLLPRRRFWLFCRRRRNLRRAAFAKSTITRRTAALTNPRALLSRDRATCIARCRSDFLIT